MAGACNVSIIVEVEGLDKDTTFVEKFTVTTTPTLCAKNIQIQAVADTEEAINLCGIATVELMIIKCVSNDVDIDCDWVTALNADINLAEGESCAFKPAGTVYIKNNDAGEQATVSVLIIGSA